MPRRSSAGCFNLPCKCPVKNHLLGPSSEDECPVKNNLLDLTAEDLSLITCDFSPENLIGDTQFGKLYRGKMSGGSDQDKTTKDVTVKIMVGEMRHFDVSYDRLPRLEDELKFLQAPRFRGNPNLVKVIGCCREERTLGIVYDLNPQDTLHNFIIRDDFKWLQRVKTALALASLLNYLHDGNTSYMLRNFDLAHIAVDQADRDFDPRDFHTRITKREYRRGCSLVHQSLEADPGFDPRDGPKITKLGMQCIEYKQEKRPAMKQVVKRLKALRVVQQHGEAFYGN